MTEEELLAVFQASASQHVTPGALTPGGLAWIEHQVELAAARGAEMPELRNEQQAKTLADNYFSTLLEAARNTNRPRVTTIAAEPVITVADLDIAMAAMGWPFNRRP